MRIVKTSISIFLLVSVMAFVLPLVEARSAGKAVIVGVNLVNEPYKQTPEEQENTLQELNKAHVQVIRCGIPDNKPGMDFIQRVHDHGIKVLWLTGPTPVKGTPWPHAPNGVKGFWNGYPLSKADPDLSGAKFAHTMAQLEAKQVDLVGIEVGNELNWAGFNADFSLPAKGRVLQTNDLTHDSEGTKVAEGYLQYAKVLRAFKDVRDHSKLYQKTPLITAGLADCGGAENWLKHVKADLVSIPATLDFLRAHGLDDLVDGYGIHCYPHCSKDPGTKESEASVRAHIELNGIGECQPAGSKIGKPCWFTEWGVDNSDEENRSKQVEDIRKYYRELAKEGRLQGMFFYTWQGFIHAAKEDGASAFRGGELSKAGKMAIKRM